jgi:dTDP-glucose 4,6-dehydratase
MDELLERPIGEARKLITFVKDRPGHDRRYAIDATKLKEELNWEPSVQAEEGLRMTASWYLYNAEWLENVTSGAYQKYYEQQYQN